MTGGSKRFGLVRIFLILALLVLVPFLIWGDFFESMFSEEGSREWLRQWGPWAWLAGIVLLMLDLFLPLPGTMIIAALGYIYGIWLGGLIGAAGSIAAGLLAYGICRSLGRRGALWIAGEEDLAKGERVFRRSGGWIVALSRWLPMMPEIVACAAGLARMPFRLFVAALICGSAPLGFAYAAVGHYGHERPGVALMLSLVVPPILWALVHPLVRSRMKG